MKIFGILILLALSQTPVQSIDIDRLGESLFIGQSYPSGNVYLRPFSGDSKEAAFWPQRLSLIAVGEVKSDLPAVRRGVFNRVLANQEENDIIKSLYIPGAEGMDEDHDPCGLGTVARMNPAHVPLSTDFFQAMFDHCEPNDGIGVYRTEPSSYSVMVVAVADNVSLVSHKISVDKDARPLGASEAVQIFEGVVREGNLTVRLSTYDDPGNAGHLASVYILDVFRNGQLIKKFEISQPQGVL